MTEGSPPERKGKFASTRDELLYRICLSGWSIRSSGYTLAPTGYFYEISFEPDEVPEAAEAFEAEIDEAGIEPTELIGYHLVVEDEQGFVAVHDFSGKQHLSAAFDELEHHYRAWAEAVQQDI